MFLYKKSELPQVEKYQGEQHKVQNPVYHRTMDNTKYSPSPTFRKPVEALVLMPTKGSLSPLARKMFNFILHATQVQALGVIESGKTYSGKEFFEGHTFVALLKDLLKPISKANPVGDQNAEDVNEKNVVTEAKKCFTEMRRAESNWSAPDEQAEILFSSISLLSQAEILKVHGVLQARWAFPPKIMKLLIESKLYTPLDNEQIAKFKTYAAIALYEICVRYKFKGKAEAYTATHELEWWVDALTASPKINPKNGKPKLRPWTKFKYDQGNKAIEEINEKSNIRIELIEHKGKGKTIISAQFKVTHKDIESQVVTAIEVKKMSPELAEMAIRLGVNTSIISNLIRDGQSEIGLKAALAKLGSRNLDLKPIESIASYLKAVLAEVNLTIGHTPQSATVLEQTVHPRIDSAFCVDTPMAMTYKDERRSKIRAELLSLTIDEQQTYAYLALAELKMSRMSSPSMIEKVESGQWANSPILVSKMVNLFAVEKYGPQWGVEQTAEQI